MAYFTMEQLNEIGFKYVGSNVKISTKASIYDPECISIDNNSRVDDFCVLSGNITIGKNVHVTVFCNLAGGEKGIIMEDFTTLSYGVNVFTQSDDYTGKTLTNSTVPKTYKDETKKAVIIKKHVIVGAGSMVFPGVTLSEGCSVGAMSLVTKDTDAWKIYIGIPAKPVKDRKKELLELEKVYIQDMIDVEKN